MTVLYRYAPHNILCEVRNVQLRVFPGRMPVGSVALRRAPQFRACLPSICGLAVRIQASICSLHIFIAFTANFCIAMRAGKVTWLYALVCNAVQFQGELWCNKRSSRETVNHTSHFHQSRASCKETSLSPINRTGTWCWTLW